MNIYVLKGNFKVPAKKKKKKKKQKSLINGSVAVPVSDRHD